MGTEFDINLGGLTIYLNGSNEASYDHHEQIAPQLFIDYDADGNVVSLEVLGPMKVSTEKSVQRVAHRMDAYRMEGEDENVTATRAHVTAAEIGSSRMNEGGVFGSNRDAMERGKNGGEESRENGDENNEGRVGERGAINRHGMHADAVEDMHDSNTRDMASGAAGRHGVAGSAVNPAPIVEEEEDDKPSSRSSRKKEEVKKEEAKEVKKEEAKKPSDESDSPMKM